MAGRILFVCAQNVCRSAYLAATVGAGLDDAPSGYDVVSRGARAIAGLPMCPVALSQLAGEAVSRAQAHRSRLLKAGDIDRAGLILTATTAERSAVALLTPSARARTFTVRQFLRLADAGGGMPAVGGASLEEVVTRVHTRRGVTDLASSPRRSLRQRGEVVSPLDIPDRHRERPAAHRALFADLSADAAALLRVFSHGGP